MAKELERYTEQDARVDKYVRGKMSADEEIEFEAEFLLNPNLYVQVEEASRLKLGLEALSLQGELAHVDAASEMADQALVTNVRTNEQKKDEIEQGIKEHWLSYFAVPQTALGALAASLLLLPLLYINPGQHDDSLVEELAVYSMEMSRVRSGGNPQNEAILQHVEIGLSASNAIFEFTVDPIMAAPPSYHMKLIDDEGNTIWQKENLNVNAELKIYVEMNTQALDEGVYYFELSEVKPRSVKKLRRGIRLHRRS